MWNSRWILSFSSSENWLLSIERWERFGIFFIESGNCVNLLESRFSLLRFFNSINAKGSFKRLFPEIFNSLNCHNIEISSGKDFRPQSFIVSDLIGAAECPRGKIKKESGVSIIFKFSSWAFSGQKSQFFFRGKGDVQSKFSVCRGNLAGYDWSQSLPLS